VALFALVFMIISLIFTARVLGAARTQARIMHLVNFLTLILGTFIIVLSAITAFINFNGRAIPYTLLFIGSVIFTVSFLGYYGTKWKSIGMLNTYVVIVIVMTIMLLVTGIICYTNKPAALQYVSDHWEEIKNPGQNDAADLEKFKGNLSSYLTLLGSVAIGGVVFMIFAGVVTSFLVSNIKAGHYKEDVNSPINEAPKGGDTKPPVNPHH